MEIYAEIPNPKPDLTEIVQLDGVEYGPDVFYGIMYKPYMDQETDETDEQGNKKTKRVYDLTKAYYDPTSQLIIKNKELESQVKNNQVAALSLMKSAINQQSVNLQLMKAITTKGGN